MKEALIISFVLRHSVMQVEARMNSVVRPSLTLLLAGVFPFFSLQRFPLELAYSLKAARHSCSKLRRRTDLSGWSLVVFPLFRKVFFCCLDGFTREGGPRVFDFLLFVPGKRSFTGRGQFSSARFSCGEVSTSFRAAH